MKPHVPPAESVATLLLCGAAVLAPAALGATWVWGRLALEAAMAFTVIAWVTSGRWRGPLVVVPLAIAALPLLQLVPLPDRVLTFLAPVSAGAWKVALQGLPGAWGTISVDPGATTVAIFRLLLGAATVAAVADLSRHAPLRSRLSWALAISAVAIWTLGLAFPVGRDRILLGFIDLKGPIRFGKTPVEEPLQTAGFGHPDAVTVSGMTYEADGWGIGDGFGSYICSNHFAGAIYLTLPVAIAIWLARSQGRLPAAARFGVAGAVWCGAAWTVGAMAGSRAGTAALLLAGGVLTALAAPLRWQRRLAAAAVVAFAAAVTAGVILLAAVDLPPDFEKSVPTKLQPHMRDLLRDGRVAAARIAVRMFRASPLLGTGLGTFGNLQPRFAPRPPRLAFAHNDYAQLMGETGLVGVTIVMGLLYFLAQRFRAFLREPRTTGWLLAAGAWAALAGIGLHSLFDWNLHVPANGFLTCLVGGIAIGSSFAPTMPPRTARSGVAIAAASILVGACVLALAFLTRDACSRAAGRAVSEAIALARQAAAKQATAEEAADELRAAVQVGQSAAAWDPANARLAALLGQATLHLDATDAGDGDRGAQWFGRARIKAAAVRGLAEAATPVPPRVRIRQQ